MNKKLFITFFVLALSFCAISQNSPGQIVADKIATKMKDSLSLSNSQRGKVFGINIKLHNQKHQIWQQYNGSDSLIKVNLQLVENTRDSLYQAVLTQQQYTLYLEKKRWLVNNN